MKSYCLTLLGMALATTFASAQSTPIVGAGSSYTNIFSPDHTTTYDVPGGGLLNVTLSNGSVTETSGIWDLKAQGGANLDILFIGLLESGAQTALNAGNLEFNISNDNNALLSALGVGTSVHYGWQATAMLDTPAIGFTDNTNYHITFDVDGSNGLLDSILGVTPSFSFELIDGLGNTLASHGNGNLINLAGLLGTGVTSGTVTLDYNVLGGLNGGFTPTGPLGIRFTGDATLGATALGAGTDFATISNLNISATPIPEPAGLMLIAMLGAVTTLIRHRRPFRA